MLTTRPDARLGLLPLARKEFSRSSRLRGRGCNESVEMKKELSATKTEETMKDGTEYETEYTRRVLSDRQAAVLDELQVKGENGCADMYRRALKSLKNRLIMDDEYDPSENMSLVRVLTMLELDLESLSEGVCQQVEEADKE